MPQYEIFLIHKFQRPVAQQLGYLRGIWRTAIANGAVCRGMQNMGVLPLTYRMKKNRSYNYRARYMRLKFEMNPGALARVRDYLDNDVMTVRYLTVTGKTTPSFPQIVKRNTDSYHVRTMELLTLHNQKTFLNRIRSFDSLVAKYLSARKLAKLPKARATWEKELQWPTPLQKLEQGKEIEADDRKLLDEYTSKVQTEVKEREAKERRQAINLLRRTMAADTSTAMSSLALMCRLLIWYDCCLEKGHLMSMTSENVQRFTKAFVESVATHGWSPDIAQFKKEQGARRIQRALRVLARHGVEDESPELVDDSELAAVGAEQLAALQPADVMLESPLLSSLAALRSSPDGHVQKAANLLYSDKDPSILPAESFLQIMEALQGNPQLQALLKDSIGRQEEEARALQVIEEADLSTEVKQLVRGVLGEKDYIALAKKLDEEKGVQPLDDSQVDYNTWTVDPVDTIVPDPKPPPYYGSDEHIVSEEELYGLDRKLRPHERIDSLEVALGLRKKKRFDSEQDIVEQQRKQQEKMQQKKGYDDNEDVQPYSPFT